MFMAVAACRKRASPGLLVSNPRGSGRNRWSDCAGLACPACNKAATVRFSAIPRHSDHAKVCLGSHGSGSGYWDARLQRTRLSGRGRACLGVFVQAIERLLGANFTNIQQRRWVPWLLSRSVFIRAWHQPRAAACSAKASPTISPERSFEQRMTRVTPSAALAVQLGASSQRLKFDVFRARFLRWRRLVAAFHLRSRVLRVSSTLSAHQAETRRRVVGIQKEALHLQSLQKASIINALQGSAGCRFAMLPDCHPAVCRAECCSSDVLAPDDADIRHTRPRELTITAWGDGRQPPDTLRFAAETGPPKSPWG
ncbi:hypothetical protein PHYPSEUDO_000118 [Phytophthora pseudosyringae]|uniref:Uncharacterized protein n=1 Tax=Phytophthora pseudosyringae TaxID=221518 RepID=A0A8T1WL75_9STRA|nr:hypothetical protein PHYPSEUDO_000118 [Phytophthora pseudosyringae]